MDREKMIRFLADNSSAEELREDLIKFCRQVMKAKAFIREKYYDENLEEWENKDFQQVYYFLDFDNNEVE